MAKKTKNETTPVFTIHIEQQRDAEIKDKLFEEALHAAIGEVEALLRENWPHIRAAYEQNRIENANSRYVVGMSVGMQPCGRNVIVVNAACSYGTKRKDETEGITVGRNDQPELQLGGVIAPTEDQIAMAKQIILETRRASTSSIQRRMRIGYTLASAIMDRLEEDGVVGPSNGADPREILVEG